MLREGQTARTKAAASKRSDEGDINLGLDTHSGLRPFEPKLLKVR